MKTKEIKNKRVQDLVVSKIVNNVHFSLSWCPDFEVEVYRTEKGLITIEASHECSVITSAVLTDLFKIAEEYVKVYPSNVGYYVSYSAYFSDDYKTIRHKPTFNISVRLSD